MLLLEWSSVLFPLVGKWQFWHIFFRLQWLIPWQRGQCTQHWCIVALWVNKTLCTLKSSIPHLWSIDVKYPYSFTSTAIPPPRVLLLSSIYHCVDIRAVCPFCFFKHNWQSSSSVANQATEPPLSLPRCRFSLLLLGCCMDVVGCCCCSPAWCRK